MNRLTRGKKDSRWILASCPSTGEEVVGSGSQKEFDNSDIEATWWFCPACGGWHLQSAAACDKNQQGCWGDKS